MKVELKSVRIAHWASDETNCFTAAIWINGKKVGSAGNQGRGGPTDLEFTDKEAGSAFKAWAKAQPPVPSEHFPDGLAMDAELYIDMVLEDYLKGKDQKRIEKTAAKEKARLAQLGFKTLQLEFGGTFLWLGFKDESQIDAVVAKMQAKHKFTECKRTVL